MGHPAPRSAKTIPEKFETRLSDGQILIIRGILPADIPKLAEVYCRAYETNGADEHWTPDRAELLLKKLGSDSPGLSFVAQVGNEIVGAAFGNIRPWESGKVVLEGKELFVDPFWRTYGIGTELLKARLLAAETFHNANEVEFITFTEKEEVKGPQGFHERSGLKRVPELQIMAGSTAEYGAALDARSKRERSR